MKRRLAFSTSLSSALFVFSFSLAFSAFAFARRRASSARRAAAPKTTRESAAARREEAARRRRGGRAARPRRRGAAAAADRPRRVRRRPAGTAAWRSDADDRTAGRSTDDAPGSETESERAEARAAGVMYVAVAGVSLHATTVLLICWRSLSINTRYDTPQN